MEKIINYGNEGYDIELAQQASLNLEFYQKADTSDQICENPIDITDSDQQLEGGEAKYFKITKSNNGVKGEVFKPNIFNKNTYNRLKKAREA